MNRLTEVFNGITKGDKRIKFFAALGFAAILLILLSELTPSSTSVKEKKTEENYSDYIESLETETEELISSISGAGRCRVMLTLKNSKESVFAKNTDENTQSGSISIKNEYVLYDGQDGEAPLLIKQYYPDIQGVAVVMDGADNTQVKECVINTVSALFDVPVSKISVSKYKG